MAILRGLSACMDEIAGRDADVGQFRKANARATARLLARRAALSFRRVD
jgi:hypothetical protein